MFYQYKNNFYIINLKYKYAKYLPKFDFGVNTYIFRKYNFFDIYEYKYGYSYLDTFLIMDLHKYLFRVKVYFFYFYDFIKTKVRDRGSFYDPFL